MLHPASVKILTEIGNTFTKEYMTTDLPDVSQWITQLES